jgi:hypothetical protein
MNVYRQDRDELLDYTFNWSPSLAAGETILTSAWTVPAGITAGPTSLTDTTTTQWLSGGSMGEQYTITNTIATSDLREFERSFAVLIIASSSEVVPSAPTAITALDLISSSLRLIGVLASGETADGDQAQDGLSTLNDFIDEIRTQRLSIFTTKRSVYPLTSGTESYFIGGGGAFDQQRPLWIPYAGLIIDTSADVLTEIPIDVYSIQQYADVQQKALQSSFVQCIYYDHNWNEGLGKIFPYPIPNVDNTSLVLYTPQAVNEFTSLTQQVTFPPGYRKMIRYNLALQLAPEYGRPIDPAVLAIAKESMASVKSANSTQPGLMRVDPGLMGSPRTWNWLTGTDSVRGGQ